MVQEWIAFGPAGKVLVPRSLTIWWERLCAIRKSWFRMALQTAAEIVTVGAS